VAIWAQTRDVVRSAFETARFEELVGRVQSTAEQKIEGDVVKVVEIVGERFGFAKTERQSVLKQLFFNGWVTLVVIDPTDQKAYELQRDQSWKPAEIQ
jgi:hypothetical protein